MRLHSFLWCILCICTLALYSCKGNEPKPNPCEAEKLPTNSDIKIEESILFNKFETDTVMTSNRISFSVPEKYTSYEWRLLGSSQRWTTPEFGIVFLSDIGTYEVTLIGKRAPKTACFPTDDGIDTLKRKFVVLPHETSPIIGAFEGTHEGETEKFTVTIAYDKVVSYDGSSIFEGYHIKNINKGCVLGGPIYPNVGLRLHHGGNAFELNHVSTVDVQYSCFGPLAKGYLVNNNKLVVEYTYADHTKPFTAQGYPRIAKKFIGYRKP
ncbi:MAG: hypothetical protein EAZ95_16120 [Bacteroidetes bacterium]|nr:MAG: hypothetical protein EAZ95_16120 [Bacteroidota bacterium]